MPHLQSAISIPFHDLQLEFMSHLADSRLEWLDPFFRFLNYFDTPYFFFVLVPIIWLGFSYRWGLRIFYWLIFSNLINGSMKLLFGWPRPSTDDPLIGLFHPVSYGFPSGGAQTCMFLGALLIYYWRKPAAWAIGAVYILLISFSRLYLGVHYPVDILGGWTFALLLFLLFIATKEPSEKFLVKKGPFFCLSLSLAVPLAIAWLAPDTGTRYMMGAAAGVGLGTYFSLKYHLFMGPPKNLMEGFGRSFIGITTTYLLILLWPESRSFAKSFTVGLFMSTAASPICRWFIQRKIK